MSCFTIQIGVAYESPICVLQFKPMIYEDIKNWYFGNKGTNRVQTSHSEKPGSFRFKQSNMPKLTQISNHVS